METDTKTEGEVLDTTNETGEGTELGDDTISIPKSDYDKLNQTLGSLKRELKDLKKPKDETKETPITNQKSDDALLQKLERISLRQAGIEHPDDIELARKTADKWKVDIDEVLGDEDFKAKLGKQQDARSNAVATSNVRGTNGTSQAKNTPEYWLQKGTPPTPADVPDRKVRAAIIMQMVGKSKSNGKTFYND